MLILGNSVLRIPFVSEMLRNGVMTTIDQIYRDNLRLLVKEIGTQEALAEAIDKAPAQLSQWINGSKDSKTGKPRALSRATARDIENKLGKPEGWMDQPHAALRKAKPAGEPTNEVLQQLRLLAKLMPELHAKILNDISTAAEQAAGIVARGRGLRRDDLAPAAPTTLGVPAEPNHPNGGYQKRKLRVTLPPAVEKLIDGEGDDERASSTNAGVQKQKHHRGTRGAS